MEPQTFPRSFKSRRPSHQAGVVGFAAAAAAGGVALLVQSLTGSLTLALGCVMIIATALAWWSQMRARKDSGVADRVAQAAEALSSGKTFSRLDQTAQVSSSHGVADAFNHLFDAIGGLAHRVMVAVHGLQHIPAQITSAMVSVQESAAAQEEAVEETASLLANINTSMFAINDKLEGLQSSAEESASSIVQMGCSVDEVARNAATLHQSVEGNTSSLHEMGASIRQVAESAEHVDQAAEQTAASVVEMDRILQEMTTHASEASELTERVQQGADRGNQAVNDTISDIKQIHERTSDARDTLGTLVQSISEIDGILNEIAEINDETNLLSLNAAIIAAQAGEQGKAFLVVANHVKILSKRTSASTKSIGILVHAIQTESARAVDAMSAGIEAIDKGVSRSRAAGTALDEILESSKEANLRVEGIAQAVEQQSQSSKLVSRAAQDTSAQVQQISSAMSQQKNVSEAMLQNAEASVDVCLQMHRSTEEQRTTGRYLSKAISNIADMISQIRQSTDNHAKASESVSDAVMRQLANAHEAGKQVPEIRAMLEQLSEGTQAIVDELSIFESSNTDFE